MRAKNRDSGSGGLVYSSDHGKMCAGCGAPIDDCVCHSRRSHSHQSTPIRDGIVRVGRETKGRKGAGVTIVIGAPMSGEDLAMLCTRLKKRCGSGGTVKDHIIEIQGDHRDVILAELSSLGWTVKRVGG